MSDPQTTFAKTISLLQKLGEAQHIIPPSLFHKELAAIATNYARAMGGYSRDTKERYLQSVMDYSNKMGLRLVACISTTTSYGKYGGSSIFLPEGSYGFAPSMSTQSGITFCAEIPNDSIESCFVAKGYRVMCFNGNLNDTDQLKVTHPGSYDFSWHGFSKKTSSIRIEPDTISPAQYNALEQKADATQSQLEYQKRQNATLQSQVSSLQQNIQSINREVKSKDLEIQQELTKIGEYEKANQDLRNKNELMVEESNEQQLKARVMALESFTSLHQTLDSSNMNMTIALSALIALLAASFIHIKLN